MFAGNDNTLKDLSSCFVAVIDLLIDLDGLAGPDVRQILGGSGY